MPRNLQYTTAKPLQQAQQHNGFISSYPECTSHPSLKQHLQVRILFLKQCFQNLFYRNIELRKFSFYILVMILVMISAIRAFLWAISKIWLDRYSKEFELSFKLFAFKLSISTFLSIEKLTYCSIREYIWSIAKLNPSALQLRHRDVIIANRNSANYLQLFPWK